MTKLTSHKLRELKEELRGKYDQVAKESRFSKFTVQKVLLGTWYNETVIMAAIKVRDKERKKKQAQIKSLESRI